MLRYAITDGARTNPDMDALCRLLRASVGHWAADRVDFIQLREKSLPGKHLIGLGRELVHLLQESSSGARLLVNARADIAVAAGAHGVHLTAAPGELTPEQVRKVYAGAGGAGPVVSVSCHTLPEVARAHDGGADLILFGPVFEKVVGAKVVGAKVVGAKVAGDATVAPGAGLAMLGAAVAAARSTPVLALGGVTAANTAACLASGAAGIAGIRLFA